MQCVRYFATYTATEQRQHSLWFCQEQDANLGLFHSRTRPGVGLTPRFIHGPSRPFYTQVTCPIRRVTSSNYKYFLNFQFSFSELFRILLFRILLLILALFQRSFIQHVCFLLTHFVLHSRTLPHRVITPRGPKHIRLFLSHKTCITVGQVRVRDIGTEGGTI